MEPENKMNDEQLNEPAETTEITQNAEAAEITPISETAETAEITENAIRKERNSESDVPSLEALRLTLEKYGIEVSEPQMKLLEKFCELQWDWNAKINLTRHTTYEKFVTRDLLDALAFSEFLAPNEKVLDVGSGNGVPGILLGILRPDISVSLVECVGKKAKVLADIIHELQLPIPVYCALGQDILGNWQFHTLTFRAVASMKKILEWFKPCWLHFDRMLLVKGPKWVDERGEARHYSLLKGLALRKLKEYSIPKPEVCQTSVNPLEEPNPNKQAPTRDAEMESVILQICPEEKIGKDSLCVLSSLETSKSRNKFDHNRRKKSRVTEETIEYVEATDFDGLDEDGELIKLEKNNPYARFARNRSESRENDRNRDRNSPNDRNGRDDRNRRNGRTDESRKSFGEKRSFSRSNGRGNFSTRQNRENSADDSSTDFSMGFGGRSGLGERKRFGGSRPSGKRRPRNREE